MVCYSVVDPESFVNASKKWLPELKTNAQSVPTLLVGTKLDLKGNEEYLNEKGVTPVCTEDGEKCWKELGLHAFIETSALTQKNLKDCFDTAILAVMKERDGKNSTKKKSGGFCSVL